MRLDPELVAETKGWLKKAVQDIRTAKALISENPPITESCVFHCQQAVEKSLKGFLTWHQKPFRKTHNIEELGELEEPDLSEARDAILIAEKVLKEICSRLPKEVNPTSSK